MAGYLGLYLATKQEAMLTFLEHSVTQYLQHATSNRLQRVHEWFHCHPSCGNSNSWCRLRWPRPVLASLYRNVAWCHENAVDLLQTNGLDPGPNPSEFGEPLSSRFSCTRQAHLWRYNRGQMWGRLDWRRVEARGWNPALGPVCNFHSSPGRSEGSLPSEQQAGVTDLQPLRLVSASLALGSRSRNMLFLDLRTTFVG